MAVPFNATGLWPSASFGRTPAFAAGESGAVRIDLADRTVLRGLAMRLRALASRDQEAGKREAWYAHNSLKHARPLILVDPENGWNEIIRPADLACSGPLARRWEMVLRKELEWAEEIRDDRPVEPVFEIGYTASDSGWGVEEAYRGGTSGQAYAWEAALRSSQDARRLKFPEIAVDWRTTTQTLELALEVFRGILDVKLRGVWWWSFGMTHDLARLVGLERIMLLVYDDPELLHRLMAFLRNTSLAKLDFLEREALLSANNDNGYVGSGGIGYSREVAGRREDGSPVRAAELWGFAESQETLGLSPAMFEEFVFRYQLPVLDRFGLNCYGCCEPLDARWSVVSRTPRLRRVSVSAWADQRSMAEALGDRYIFSRKPPPSLLALPHMDRDAARADVRATLEAARGCVVELVMKDNHTLGGNPRNLVDWVRVCREEIDRATGCATR